MSLKPTITMIEAINKKLQDHFGYPQKIMPSNSLESLVRGILSQNTSDNNRDLAFNRLKAVVPDFKDLFNTDEAVIEAAIRPAGLAKQRTTRIKYLVNWLNDEFGEIDCDFFCQTEPDESFRMLTSLPGIGVKTAAVFLLFVCGFHFFPVDTHIKRILKRIGFFPGKFTAEKIQMGITPYVPEGMAYNLHLNLLKLGRNICFPRKPLCIVCPINKICLEGKERINNEKRNKKRN